MFFEVCLLSFGLFAGSELFKKVKPTAKKKLYPPGRLKKRHNKKPGNQPLYKISIRKPQETGEIKNCSDIYEDYVAFRTALEALTEEISLLREEIIKLQKAKPEIPVKMIQPALNASAESSEGPDKSSIFKQIIEDNIKLREM